MDAIKRNRQGIALALAAAGALSAQSAVAAPKKVPAPATAGEPGRQAQAGGDKAHAAKRSAIHVVRNVPLPPKRPLPEPPPRRPRSPRPPSAPAALPAADCRSPARRCSIRRRGVSGPFAVAPSAAATPDDIAAVKQVIEATRKGKDADADAAENAIGDPVARKLAEWIILRSDNTNPSFERYAAFVTANPSWPHAPLFRRRAENALWNDKVDDAAVLAFFANHKPITAKGRYMLARALLAKGDRDGAAALVREAWRHDECTRRRREQGARDVRQPAHAAPTTRRAWSSASMPTTSKPACAPPTGSAATIWRSAAPAPR